MFDGDKSPRAANSVPTLAGFRENVDYFRDRAEVIKYIVNHGFGPISRKDSNEALKNQASDNRNGGGGIAAASIGTRSFDELAIEQGILEHLRSGECKSYPRHLYKLGWKCGRCRGKKVCVPSWRASELYDETKSYKSANSVRSLEGYQRNRDYFLRKRDVVRYILKHGFRPVLADPLSSVGSSGSSSEEAPFAKRAKQPLEELHPEAPRNRASIEQSILHKYRYPRALHELGWRRGYCKGENVYVPPWRVADLIDASKSVFCKSRVRSLFGFKENEDYFLDRAAIRTYILQHGFGPASDGKKPSSPPQRAAADTGDIADSSSDSRSLSSDQSSSSTEDSDEESWSEEKPARKRKMEEEVIVASSKKHRPTPRAEAGRWHCGKHYPASSIE